LVISWVSESDPFAAGQREAVDVFLRHVQCHRNREERPICEPNGIDHAVIVRLIHESLQWTESAIDDQLEIAKLTLGQNNIVQGKGFLLQ